MTLDAMHWVWTQSRSKANARVALLYVADQVRTLACEVRVAQREFMDALNSNSKSTTEAAVKKAVELGELEIVEAATGRRPALYRLPKAVGYVRSTVGSSPVSGEKDSASSPEIGEQSGDQGRRSSPKSGERENRSSPDFDRSSPKTGAPPHTQTTQASQPDRADAFTYIQPLIRAMTNAGITVTWSMPPRDIVAIADVMERAGVDAMVRYALDTKATSRQPIRYATFFLRGGWKGLPPKSDTPPPRPAAAEKPEWCGDLDCDEITRTREVETPTGHFVLVPCPDCHPNRKKAA